MSVRGMITSTKNMFTQIPEGSFRCPTTPDGQPWVDPTDTDRWADDGGRNNDGECSFIGKCPRCGGKYRIQLIEGIVETVDCDTVVESAA